MQTESKYPSAAVRACAFLDNTECATPDKPCSECNKYLEALEKELTPELIYATGKCEVTNE